MNIEQKPISRLTQKLGFSLNDRILVYEAPPYYLEIVSLDHRRVYDWEEREGVSFDAIHIFCRSIYELRSMIRIIRSFAVDELPLWISWPKSTSGMDTDLKRNEICQHLREVGYSEEKVISFDDTWSALCFRKG